MIPAIGPTASWWWHGLEGDLAGSRPSAPPPRACRPSPRAARRRRPRRASARTSPRHAIGGPACSSRRSASSSGSTSPARAHVDAVRADGEHPLERLRVGRLDRRVGDEAREAQADRVVAVGGRAPVERHDLGAVRGGRGGERLDADVHEAGRPSEQSSERAHAGTSVAIRVSARAAAALLDAARTAPASRSARSWRRGPAGRRRSRRRSRRSRGASSRAGDLGDHGREVRGRVVGGEVAEDDVEHDHGGARVVARGAEHVEADGRVDHRVRAADGEAVVAEVEDQVRVREPRRASAVGGSASSVIGPIAGASSRSAS